MRLKPGATPAQALAALHESTQALHRATQVIGQDPALANAYVQAVSQVERLLRGSFVDVSLDQLRTQRFWAINSLESVRLIEMVNDERDAQVTRLERVAAQIQRMQDRVAGENSIAVLDTHVLLHYCLFDEINWPSVVGGKEVLLIVPLRVIDELDEKKAARRPDIRERARTVIRHIEACLDRNGAVRAGVRLDIFGVGEVDRDAYRRPQLPADVEILDICEAVAAYAGSERTQLVSGDLGMRIRARERALRVLAMPEDLELTAAADGPQESSPG
jgi:PIN domain